MIKRFFVLGCLILFVSCGRSTDDSETRSKARQEQAERQEILDETRGGGFKDPGGALEIREDEAQRQDELQDSIREIDEQ